MRPNQALKLKGRTQEGLLGAALQFCALGGWLAATLRSTMGLRRLKGDPLPRRRCSVVVSAAAPPPRPLQPPRVVTRAVGDPAGARWRPRGRRSRERAPVVDCT